MVGKNDCCFYGYPANVTTATKVYEWLWNVIHRMADSYQTKVWKQGNGVKGVYGSFVQGFLTGLKETLDANCKALKLQSMKTLCSYLTNIVNKIQKHLPVKV